MQSAEIVVKSIVSEDRFFSIDIFQLIKAWMFYKNESKKQLLLSTADIKMLIK